MGLSRRSGRTKRRDTERAAAAVAASSGQPAAVLDPPRSPVSPSKTGIASASAGRIGMWVFLATDVMGFGGLLLAYAILRVRAGAWPDPATRFDRPLAAVLTFVLLFSGGTMTAAVVAAREGKGRAARILTALTALCGLIFVAGQGIEFQALAVTRHVGLTADHAAALFYVITAYHGLHVLVGVALLVAIAGRSRAVSISASAASPVAALEVTSLYWQFIDVVWLVIFTALYLLPPVIRG